MLISIEDFEAWTQNRFPEYQGITTTVPSTDFLRGAQNRFPEYQGITTPVLKTKTLGKHAKPVPRIPGDYDL